MTLQLSAVVVYPPDTKIQEVERVLEGVFDAELDVGKHTLVGGACARITGVRVPDGLAFHAAKRRTGGSCPTCAQR